jgi:hypothetical protein
MERSPAPCGLHFRSRDEEESEGRQGDGGRGDGFVPASPCHFRRACTRLLVYEAHVFR